MNVEQAKKCSRQKRKCYHPNLLFKKWLTEWKEDAQEKNSNMQFNCNRALKSLQLYPLPLHSGNDCKILAHFGEKMCSMIDKKLQKHIEEYGPINWADYIKIEGPKTKKNRKVSHKKKIHDPMGASPKLQPKTHRKYIPAYRSGAYALLLALSDATLTAGYKGFLKREELIIVAQGFSDTSFTIAPNGSHYTAWSSMSTLIKKGLVFKCCNPARYSITEEGTALATQMKSKDVCVENSPTDHNIPVTSSFGMAHTLSDSDTEITIVNDDTSEEESVYNEPKRKCMKLGQNEPLQSHTAAAALPKSLEEVSLMEKESVEVSCDYQFSPFNFQIILCIDNAETVGGYKAGKKNMKDAILTEFTKLKVKFEVRKLHIGDFLWVAQELTSNQKKRELVLPFVVERKRMDDLASSILDGRFREQKFRLKQSGLNNPIYLVEEYGNRNTSIPLSTCEQAIVNTQIIDGFQIKLTTDIRESVSYLTSMTNYLQRKFQDKVLRCLPKESVLNDSTHFSSDTVNLMDFGLFNVSSMKNKQLSVKDMFSKHLLQLSGLSIDKAAAIVEKYPTPQLLQKAANKCHTEVEREAVLASLKCSRSGRMIGPRISSTVVQLYTLGSLS